MTHIHPQFEAVGSYALYPDAPNSPAELAQTFAEYRGGLQFHEELPKTPEQIADIEHTRAAMVAFGDAMGVDLRSRMPALEDFHYFDSEEALRDALEQAGLINAPPGMQGFAHPMCGVMAVAHAERDWQVSLDIHEGMHFVSSYDYDAVATENDDGSVSHTLREVRQGHHLKTPDGDDILWGGDELLKDMMAADALTNYWPGPDKPSFLSSYRPLAVIGAAAIQHTAKKENLPPEQIFRLLVQGDLIGNADAMRLMHDALGPEAMKAFMRFDVRETATTELETYRDLAEAMGLPAAVQAIEAMRQKNFRPNIFPWRSAASSPSGATSGKASNESGGSYPAGSIGAVGQEVAACIAELPPYSEVLTAISHVTDALVSFGDTLGTSNSVEASAINAHLSEAHQRLGSALIHLLRTVEHLVTYRHSLNLEG